MLGDASAGARMRARLTGKLKKIRSKNDLGAFPANTTAVTDKDLHDAHKKAWTSELAFRTQTLRMTTAGDEAERPDAWETTDDSESDLDIGYARARDKLRGR